ncbi:MAG: PaaI family thioesterase [Myxococcota bacterium]
MPDEAIPIDPLIFGEDQACFGCGPRNGVGMQLRFERVGDTVTTTFTARDGWDGPPGILHGGLQATLADEVGAWTVVGLRGYFGFTSSMQLRYLRPARMAEPIEARGRITETNGAQTIVRIDLMQDGKRLMSATATYVSPPAETAERIIGRALPPEWRALARPADADD